MLIKIVHILFNLAANNNKANQKDNRVTLTVSDDKKKQ
jgi:hypothetical protein